MDNKKQDEMDNKKQDEMDNKKQDKMEHKWRLYFYKVLSFSRRRIQAALS